jgi:hypothetical protein
MVWKDCLMCCLNGYLITTRLIWWFFEMLLYKYDHDHQPTVAHLGDHIEDLTDNSNILVITMANLIVHIDYEIQDL